MQPVNDALQALLRGDVCAAEFCLNCCNESCGDDESRDYNESMNHNDPISYNDNINHKDPINYTKSINHANKRSKRSTASIRSYRCERHGETLELHVTGEAGDLTGEGTLQGGDATNFLPAVLRRLHPFIHVRCHHTHCRSMSLVADTLSLHVVTHTVSRKRHSSPARVRNPREAATTAKGVSPTLLASAASAGVDGAISAVRYVGRGAAADAGRSGGLGESALRGVARPLHPPQCKRVL